MGEYVEHPEALPFSRDSKNDARRRLCVVIPVHNEAENLASLVARLRIAAGRIPHWDVEVLLVDDGSRDDSVERIHALRAAGERVGLLRLSRNFGHQAALCAGLQSAVGDAVVTMDSDLQHPPEEIPRMIEAHERGSDVVQMVRADPTGGSKGLLSTWFYRAFNHLSDTHVVPNAADFRLMSRPVLDAFIRIPEREKFLRGLIPSLGFRQTCLEFEEAPRLHGVPTYSFKASLRLARKAMLDFSTFPLRLVFWFGLTMAVVSFCFAVGHLLVKLFNWHGVEPGFTDIITAIFFLSGCILLSLGIVGRYLVMILEQVRGRPAFVVRDILPGAPLRPAILESKPADKHAGHPVGV